MLSEFEKSCIGFLGMFFIFLYLQFGWAKKADFAEDVHFSPFILITFEKKNIQDYVHDKQRNFATKFNSTVYAIHHDQG